MPKTEMSYANTIIYKIVCNDLDVKSCYVGHTTNFVKRKYNHKDKVKKSNCKEYNYKLYQIIRANGGWENWAMIEIEKYPCNDANEASKRERYFYELLNADLNGSIPSRTKKEYMKAYDILRSERSKIEKFTCECGSYIRFADNLRHLRSKKHINYISNLLE